MKNIIHIIIAILLLALTAPTRVYCQVHIVDDGSTPQLALGVPWDEDSSVSRRNNDCRMILPEPPERAHRTKGSRERDPRGGRRTP